jgi:hypothetical protein
VQRHERVDLLAVLGGEARDDEVGVRRVLLERRIVEPVLEVAVGGECLRLLSRSIANSRRSSSLRR